MVKNYKFSQISGNTLWYIIDILSINFKTRSFLRSVSAATEKDIIFGRKCIGNTGSISNDMLKIDL